MSLSTWTVPIVALFLPTLAVCAEDIKDYDSLFQSHDTLAVEIKGPFSILASERADVEEVAGIFRFVADDGSEVEFDVALRARGKRRRDPTVCSFPPLRLNFVKSQTKDTLFDHQDKIKLVTHCSNNSPRYEQTVVSEYLVYRMFNLLTDASFAVRPLQVSYFYTDGKRKRESFAFLIETNDRIGKRLGGEPIDVPRVGAFAIRAADLNIATVFAYFIGNTDFSPLATAPNEDCCHNQTLFDPGEGPYFTVPYDFDQAGIVDAPHASPNPRFKLRSVKSRLYRGRCVNNDQLPATLQLFRERRAEFVELIEAQPELTNGTRKKMLAYIDRFYKTIDNPKHVERDLIKACI